jgi:ABC transporter substrate binding protein (PQQ-dependent alcohol dehydrogenase system)
MCAAFIAIGAWAVGAASPVRAEEAGPAPTVPAMDQAEPAAPAAPGEGGAQGGTKGETKAGAGEEGPAKPAAPAAKPAAEVQTFRMAFLTQEKDLPPPPAIIDINPTDEGAAGAKLAIEDNNTTGRFTRQHFDLETVTVPLKGDVVAAFKKLVAEGQRFILVDLPAADVLKLADLPEAKDTLLFNVGAMDDRLRNQDCRSNVLHVISNRAMLADALAQYLIKKKWTKWFLAVGDQPGDRLYADAVKRAAKKFGAKVVEERKWEYSPEKVRRTEAAEIPLFTQNVTYDVLVVADESDAFGDQLLYQTWDPRPVAGTQGLIPTAWHPTHDKWGATQLQHRFEKLANRWMTPVDYSAWIAVRSLGEAATRTKSMEFAQLRDYMLGPEFGVGAFKGVPVNYRSWDHQLREPILVAWARTVVSVSPQDEFIHPVTNLDTLGYDKPESTCKLK